MDFNNLAPTRGRIKKNVQAIIFLLQDSPLNQNSSLLHLPSARRARGQRKWNRSLKYEQAQGKILEKINCETRYFSEFIEIGVYDIVKEWTNISLSTSSSRNRN